MFNGRHIFELFTLHYWTLEKGTWNEGKRHEPVTEKNLFPSATGFCENEMGQNP